MAEIRLEHLSKQFGETRILSDVSLTVRDGELFTIVGPSGCGKSTLLSLLAGLEGPTSGRIIFDGQDVTALEPRERDVALVFQSYALYPHMTVAENLAFPLRVARRRTGMTEAHMTEEVRRVAGLLGLEPLLARHPRELSGGQRQRVALGRALIRKPRLFLLDEPMSNLDAQLRAAMRIELRRLHDDLGITMIYVTHDQTEAMTLADRLVVLDRGRVQQVGTPRELYDEPANLFVAKFVGYPAMNVLEARTQDGRLQGGPFVLPCPEHAGRRGVQDGARVMAGIRPEHVLVAREGPVSGADASGSRSAPGILRSLERTGGHVSVTVDIGGPEDVLTLVGLAAQDFDGRPGNRVQVSIQRAAALHLFDPEGGRRIGAGAGGEVPVREDPREGRSLGR